MTQSDYLSKLRRELADLPAGEWQDLLSFYQEMLEDGGEAAISELGSPQELALRIRQENGYEKPRKRRAHTAAVWTLLICGSPIWLSLLIAFLSVVFSALVAVASVYLSLAACALGLAGYGVLMLGTFVPMGIFSFGGGLFCAGLALLLGKPCFLACAWICRMTGRALHYLGKACLGKEA